MIGPVGTWSGVSAGEVVGEVAEVGEVVGEVAEVVLPQETHLHIPITHQKQY